MRRNLKKYNGFVMIIFFTVCMFFSCNKSSENVNQDADRLYIESKSLIKEYLGKLNAVSDTSLVDSINVEFEKEYEKLNFSVSKGADLLLTETQNDTLANLIGQYVKLVKAKKLNYNESECFNDTISRP